MPSNAQVLRRLNQLARLNDIIAEEIELLRADLTADATPPLPGLGTGAPQGDPRTLEVTGCQCPHAPGASAPAAPVHPAQSTHPE